MQRFEMEEAEEKAERKALLEKPEDDDGFVTVTYKRKRGRNSDSGPLLDGGGLAADGAKKKRKGASELSDFYRFQVGVRAWVWVPCIFCRHVHAGAAV